MILDIFATKLGMTQAWTKQGKRLAVTRLNVNPMPVVGKRDLKVINKKDTNRISTVDCTVLEVGVGRKKLKNMDKPLKTKMDKGGFSFGVKSLQGVRVMSEDMVPTVDADINVGSYINLDSVLSVGDVVKVQGVTKGRGFAGGMKRHGFHGGPRTHGQSDRARAVGSIGAGTTPGRVFKGQRMPGHYGVETQTVSGLVVLHIDMDKNEIWLSGPIPGSIFSEVKVTKVGDKKEILLDLKASKIAEKKAEVEAEVKQEVEEVKE